MENELINEDNFEDQSISNKEQFVQYALSHHGKEIQKLNSLINKEDWSLMERIFTKSQLVKIAKDQRITQVKNGFDLMNTCDAVVHDVVIGAVRNRAQAVLTSDWIKMGKEISTDVTNTTEALLKEMSISRERFSDYLMEQAIKAEKYKDNVDAYEDFKRSVDQDRKIYYATRMKQLDNYNAKIRAIEDKYKTV